MELATILGTHTTDQPALPDWRDDAAYHDARTCFEELERIRRDAEQEVNRLWREATAGYGEVQRLPPPSDPCWAAKQVWDKAERAAQEAHRAQDRAEADAKARVQAAGEAAGRSKWAEAETEVFPRLIQWCREYEAVRTEVQQKTAVRLPEIACAVSLTAEGLTTYIDNVRREMGVR